MLQELRTVFSTVSEESLALPCPMEVSAAQPRCRDVGSGTPLSASFMLHIL